MKSKLLLLFIFSVMIASAQSFEKGQLDIHLGAGLWQTFMNKNYETKIPFLHATVELGVSDNISLGAYIGFAQTEWSAEGTENCNSGNGNGNFSYIYEYTHTVNNVIFAVKPAWHFPIFTNLPKFDIYAALLLGNNFESEEFKLSTYPYCDKTNGIPVEFESHDGFIWGIYAGGNFTVTEPREDFVPDKIFLELGYGINILNIGADFSF